MTAGENIKRIRKERGLTQKKLGELCTPQISESTIRKYELGILKPKMETVQKISNALQCKPFDLVGFAWIDNTLDIEKVQMEIEHTEQLEKLLSHEEYDYYMKYSALTDSAQDKVKSYIDFMFSDKTNRTDVE